MLLSKVLFSWFLVSCRAFTGVVVVPRAKKSLRPFMAVSSDDTTTDGAWVPVGSASCFKGLTPLRIELFGHNFCVWDDDTGQWSVLLDECPHRLAPLSQGRIVVDGDNGGGGCIECPYHGWQFATDGAIQCIPQLDDATTTTTSSSSSSSSSSLERIAGQASATSFPVHLTGDMIWAFLPTSYHGESNFASPEIVLPEDYYPGLRQDMARGATYYAHEFLCSMDVLVENGLDPAHFSFAHHGVIANRNDAGPLSSMKVQTYNATNLDIYAAYQRQGVPRERLYSYQRPFFLYTQEKDHHSGHFHAASKFWIVPIRPGQCRMLTSVEKVSRRWLPDWVTHWATHRLLAGDHFLHDAEQNLQRGGTYVQPTRSDTGPRAWQQWWKQYGTNSATNSTTTTSTTIPQQSRQEIENNWRIHTSKCSKCRAVLRRARQSRVASVAALVWGVWTIDKRKPLAATVLILLGVLGSWTSRGLCQHLEGSLHPSDVRDRSISMDM